MEKPEGYDAMTISPVIAKAIIDLLKVTTEGPREAICHLVLAIYLLNDIGRQDGPSLDEMVEEFRVTYGSILARKGTTQ